VFSILNAAVAMKEGIRPLQALGVVMDLGAILLVLRPARGGSVQPIAGPVE